MGDDRREVARECASSGNLYDVTGRDILWTSQIRADTIYRCEGVVGNPPVVNVLCKIIPYTISQPTIATNLFMLVLVFVFVFVAARIGVCHGYWALPAHQKSVH